MIWRHTSWSKKEPC